MENEEPVTQADLDRLKWFHEFHFPGGLKTRRHESCHASFHRVLEAFLAEQLERVSFRNKTVLDVGAWDGWYSFMAERAGASSVTAVDDFSQNWGAKEAVLLARKLQKSRVEIYPDVSVYELTKSFPQQQFDVILFLGVYYHLHAPYVAFSQIRSLCHPGSILIVEGVCIRDDMHSRAEVNLCDWNASKFIPTTKLLVDMLRSCYFAVNYISFFNDYQPKKALSRTSAEDLLELAQRDLKRTYVSKSSNIDVEDDDTLPKDRAFVICTPFEGFNSLHQYKPPLGLVKFWNGAEPE